MSTKTAYQCSADGSFIGETVVQEDVFARGSYLMPPNCTLTAPPVFDAATHKALWTGGVWNLEVLREEPAQEARHAISIATEDNKPVVGANEVAIIVNGQWEVVRDYRGTAYWLADGTEHRITNIGEEVPQGALLTCPSVDSTQAVDR
ncbi:hypothetical protein [Paraburkholderia sp. UCT2]|uniref:hypothetical protein n=1 Tax=Paraburkholderia sp. UCT2 TaxID=2615208 RepID=UPI001655519F|nr:hypothetical protein [Paraburkholderia sp. UCT2]MBC8729975.1 hypothetical protein [Paraburkholderia sp. UCT2]